MKLIHDFIQSVKSLMEGNPAEYPPSLFTDQKRLTGNECHKLVMKMLKKAGSLLPTVAHVSSEDRTFRDQGKRKLHGGWKPDIVLGDARNEPICFVEYESLNSSDERVFDKDIWKYQRWMPNTGIQRAPLLIITTLKNGSHDQYRLKYPKGYNWRHVGQEANIKTNPFKILVFVLPFKCLFGH